MDNKNKFGEEIKSIMEDETFGMTLSQKALNNILQNRKKTIKEKVSEFLNSEIEIPLAPALVGLVALFAITIIPKDVIKSQNEKIINIGGSQVIVRESFEVSKNENKN